MNLPYTRIASEPTWFWNKRKSGMSLAEAQLSASVVAHAVADDDCGPTRDAVANTGRSNKDGSLAWVLLLRPDDVVAQAASGPRSLLVQNHRFGALCKRVCDLSIALVALILLAPIMIAIAVVMKITDRGPVFFAHTRIGLHGRPFHCLKFRTMVIDADERLRQLLADDHQLAEQWRTTRKLARDPRITRLGWILRKTSLDELPQLINVLRGDMSCVGPRPVTAEELERYGEIAKDYLRVRPGITGLWQVCGRSQCLFTERIALDRLYVRTWSLGLDLAILLRTIPTVLNFDRTA